MYESAVVPVVALFLKLTIKEQYLNPATGREVSVKVKKLQMKCYAVVTILALMMAVLYLWQE